MKDILNCYNTCILSMKDVMVFTVHVNLYDFLIDTQKQKNNHLKQLINHICSRFKEKK